MRKTKGWRVWGQLEPKFKSLLKMYQGEECKTSFTATDHMMMYRLVEIFFFFLFFWGVSFGMFCLGFAGVVVFFK